MTTPTEADVRHLLNTIIDPCSRAAGTPAGLDDMGLVLDVEVTHGAQSSVRVTLGLTEYGCLMGSPFIAEAYKLLEPLFGPDRVRVELDGRFEWKPEHMSPGYQKVLAAAHVDGRLRLDPRAHAMPLLMIEPVASQAASRDRRCPTQRH
ncbi:DUF59 domain-containing protein [Amycolatopsis pithecellobii]|uniref:DUF59 domain-containing protein n=1 Tax=Amycolatopsis pithecellobii TaxID=664692 RepID=A0A6N7Z8Y7_9PSEU|nr:DUF59 domain-containing protein [Amycolatopsis pithecellobii]MTD57436.1 DUF59 domain-containing protein [Amycolatopsis pithecellobii]